MSDPVDQPTRRELIARAGLAAGALALGLPAAASARATAVRRRAAQPNVLVIMVDEMRAPRWFPPAATLERMLPNVAALSAAPSGSRRTSPPPTTARRRAARS